MSEMRVLLGEYVSLRRSLGFAVKEADCLLPSFVAFCEATSAGHVTTELALAWATSRPQLLAVSKRQRLTAVRGFAEYLKTVDELTEVPAPDLLPASYRRVTPHIYTDEEIEALMAAARTLSPPIRAHTYETLIGLLAVSGIRIGEAIRLDRSDIDHARSRLVVRDSKLEKGREVPLHSSTLGAARRLRSRTRPSLQRNRRREFLRLHARDAASSLHRPSRLLAAHLARRPPRPRRTQPSAHP